MRLRERGWSALTVAETPAEAVEWVSHYYEAQRARVARAVEAALAGDYEAPRSGFYPGIAVGLSSDETAVEITEPFGFVQRGAGIYTMSITRPDIFAGYLEEQLAQLRRFYDVPFIVGASEHRMPVDFAAHSYGLSKRMADAIGERDLLKIASSVGEPEGFFPLSLYSALYADEMLHRLAYYSGTDPEHFQHTIFLTNYQMYVDVFAQKAAELVAGDPERFTFVLPKREEARLRLLRADAEILRLLGSRAVADGEGGAGFCPVLREALGAFRDDLSLVLDSRNAGQMPAYHLKCPDRSGISLINIGVGPSNAATIIECIAPLRPASVIMIGHCGGLRQYQKVGMYILGEGYYRRDGVYDDLVPIGTPLLPLAEVQIALRRAIARVLGRGENDLKDVLQTGIIASTNFRTNEVDPDPAHREAILDSGALAIDMESATIAAACSRHRTPYGALLVVSDIPYNSILKSARATSKFYRDAVENHMHVGFEYWELTRGNPGALQSRKLRGRNDPPFR